MANGKITIKPGETEQARGTLSTSENVYIDSATSGTTGGKVVIIGTVTDSGYLSISGATSPSLQAGSATIVQGGVLLCDGFCGFNGGSAQNGYQDAGPTIVDNGRLAFSDYLDLGPGNSPATIDIGRTGILQNYRTTFNIRGNGGANHTSGVYLGSVVNDAGVLINAGTMRLTYGDGGTMGPGYGGRLNVTGLLTNDGLIKLNGGENFGVNDPGGGGTLDVASYGYLSNLGTIILNGPAQNGKTSSSGGEVKIRSSAANHGTMEVGGIVAVAGYFFNNGTIGLQPGGSLTVSGSLVNSGTIGGYTTPFSSAECGTLIVSGYLRNADMIQLVGSSGSSGAGTLLDSGVLINAAAIELNGDTSPGLSSVASITGTGTLINLGAIDGVGTLYNAGVIEVASGSTITTAAVVNSGTIMSTQGYAFIDTSIGARGGLPGFLTIANTDLSLGGAVAQSETVQFGAAAELTLGQALLFAGTLSGLSPSDVIDLKGMQATGVSTTGDMLDVALASGASLHFALAVPLPAYDSLSLQTNGHGGTDILVTDANAGSRYRSEGGVKFGASEHFLPP